MRLFLLICTFILTLSILEAQNKVGTTPTQENLKSTSVSIYPNPAKDYIQIKNEGPSLTTKAIYIFNINGRRVKQFKGDTVNLNISDLKSGVYLVQIIADQNTVITKKLVKL